MLLVLATVLLTVLGGTGRETGSVTPGWTVKELGSVLGGKDKGSCCLPSGWTGSAGCTEGDAGKCRGVEGLETSHCALETGMARSAPGFSLAGVPVGADSDFRA